MKKIKAIKKSPVKNKWKKWLGLVCVLGLVLVSAIFGMETSQKKEEVSAHPTNPISIGSGSKLFEVPIDGGENLEYPSSYSGYRQLNTSTPSLGKQLSEVETAETKLFSSQIRNNIIKSFVTDKENVISLQSFSSYPYGNFNVINQHKVILQSKTGEVLDTEWVYATPNSITQPSGNKSTSNANLFQKSGTNYTVVFSATGRLINTTTYIDEGTHLSISTSDDNNLVDLDGIDLKRQSIIGSKSTRAGKILSHTVIYPISQEKGVYLNVEHSNGQVSRRVDFETAPEIMSLSGPNTNYAYINDLYYVDDYTVIGAERMVVNGKLTHWICKWVINPATNRAVRTGIERYDDSNVTICQDISNDSEVFFQLNRNNGMGETQVELVKFDLTTAAMNMEPVKIFPKETRLTFSRQGAGYFYVGQIMNLEGVFENIGVQGGLYSGYMDSEFDWKSASFIQLDFPETSSTIDISSFNGKGDLFALSGTFLTREIHFIDEVIYKDNYPGEVQTGSNKEWSDQKYSSGKGNAFVSILKKTDDWSPLIKPPKPFMINSGDSDVKNSDVLDKWLLTGSKSGAMTDSDAAQVYDTIDIDSGLFIYGIDWLRERINRNPKSLVYETDGKTLKSADPIDWKSLGFDISKPGPQLVTYFVTDSQNQTSSTSTYVNNLLGSTVKDENDKFAIDAQNFHIPLTGIDSAIPDANKFKELSKTLAWSLTNNASTSGEHGNGVDENGASKDGSSAQNQLSDKVKVDETQIKALQNAKAAKPYPVDVTYKPDGGPEIVNRVWVFVTTDNTVPNTETSVTPADTKGVVIYADDYTIPYRSRLSHDVDDVVANGNAKAYNYYAKDQIAELAPLPDSSSGQSNWSITDLNVIHDPFSGGAVTLPTTVKPELNYKWSGATDFYHTQGDVTKATLDVTLTGDVLLNVRQVFQGTNDQLKELVVPTEGYLSIQNTLNNSGTPTLDSTYQSQVTVASGKKAEDPDFTTFGVDIEHLTADADLVDLSAILPEFYKCVGYSISDDKASHPSDPTSADTKVSLSRGDIHNQGEYWITIYLEPNGSNDGHPQPYSWDYKHNDLGKIVNP